MGPLGHVGETNVRDGQDADSPSKRAVQFDLVAGGKSYQVRLIGFVL